LTDPSRTVSGMYESISRSSIYVLDQDQALDFYTNTLGLELSTDLDLGFMRWLTVRVPGDPAREILLERPGPPSMDEATATQVRELLTKGAVAGSLFLTTPDAQGTYETLKGRGVDITDEPSPKPYGIDFGVRDPFGNAIRIGQMVETGLSW
jgi:catechol 2,3-dioxygenase-like lactoylglutathione lyase family enzyme